MREDEYAVLRRYLMQRARSVGLGDLAAEFLFVDRFTDRSSRYQIIEFLDLFRRQVALRDDATVRETVSRLQATVQGGVAGIQIAVPPQEPQAQEELVDLGSSVQMQDVLRQIDELRQLLIADESDG